MDMVMLPITMVTAGAAALINVWLAFRVGQMRHAAGVMIGDGGNERLIARMRAQANFVEYAPFILILIGLIELTGGPSLWLWLASALFLLARLAHPFGMDGVRWCRTIGTTVTLVLLVGLGLYAVAMPFRTAPAHHQPTFETMPSQG